VKQVTAHVIRIMEHVKRDHGGHSCCAGLQAGARGGYPATSGKIPAMKDSRWAIIDEMVSRIRSVCHPDKIIVFGSFGRGTPGPDSDVDLMVVMNPRIGKRQQAIQLYRSLSGMGLPKDIVVFTPEEVDAYKDTPGTIIYDANREGKVVYDRAA